MTHTLLLHQDPFGDWRWLLVDEDRNPTGASELGHPTRAAALDDAARYLLLEPTDNPDAWVVHTTTELLANVRELFHITSRHTAGPGNTQRVLDLVFNDTLAISNRLRALLQIPGGAR